MRDTKAYGRTRKWIDLAYAGFVRLVGNFGRKLT